MSLCVRPPKKYVSISLRLAQCTLQSGDAQQMFLVCLNIKHNLIPLSEGVAAAGEFKCIGGKILLPICKCIPAMHRGARPTASFYQQGEGHPERGSDVSKVTQPVGGRVRPGLGFSPDSWLGALSRDAPSFVVVSLAAPGAAWGHS